MSVIVDFLVGIVLNFLGFMLTMFSGVIYSVIGLNANTQIVSADSDKLGGTMMYNFLTAFPMMETIHNIFLLLAQLIVLFLLINGMVKSLFGPLAKTAENPVVLATRSAGAAFLVQFSPLISSIFLYLGTILFVEFQKVTSTKQIGERIAELTQNVDAQKMAGSIAIDAVAMWSGIGPIVLGILLVFLLIFLTTNYLKLVLEIVERYVMMCFLAILGPLFVSTLASASTTQYFFSWIRIMFSQSILLGFSSLWLNAINNALTDETYVSTLKIGWVGVILIITGFVITGHKIDRHMQTMGFTVAQSGDFGMGLFQAYHATSKMIGAASKMGVIPNNAVNKATGNQVNQASNSPMARAVAPDGSTSTNNPLGASAAQKMADAIDSGETFAATGQGAANVLEQAGFGVPNNADNLIAENAENVQGVEGGAMHISNGEGGVGLAVHSSDAKSADAAGIETDKEATLIAGTGSVTEAASGLYSGGDTDDIMNSVSKEDLETPVTDLGGGGSEISTNDIMPTSEDGSSTLLSPSQATPEDVRQSLSEMTFNPGDSLMITDPETGQISEFPLAPGDLTEDGHLKMTQAYEDSNLNSTTYKSNAPFEDKTHFVSDGRNHAFEDIAGNEISVGRAVDGDMFLDKDGEYHKFSGGTFTTKDGNVLAEKYNEDGQKENYWVPMDGSSSFSRNDDGSYSVESRSTYQAIGTRDEVDFNLDYNQTRVPLEQLSDTQSITKDTIVEAKDSQGYTRQYSMDSPSVILRDDDDKTNRRQEGYDMLHGELYREQKSMQLTDINNLDDRDMKDVNTEGYRHTVYAPDSSTDVFAIETPGHLNSNRMFGGKKEYGLEHQGSKFAFSEKSYNKDGSLKIEDGNVSLYNTITKQHEDFRYDDIKNTPVGVLTSSVNGINTNIYGQKNVADTAYVYNKGASGQLVHTSTGDYLRNEAQIVNTKQLSDYQISRLTAGNNNFGRGSEKIVVAAAPSLFAGNVHRVTSEYSPTFARTQSFSDTQAALRSIKFPRDMAYKFQDYRNVKETDSVSFDRSSSVGVISKGEKQYGFITKDNYQRVMGKPELAAKFQSIYPPSEDRMIQAKTYNDKPIYVFELSSRHHPNRKQAEKFMEHFSDSKINSLMNDLAKANKTKGNVRF